MKSWITGVLAVTVCCGLCGWVLTQARAEQVADKDVFGQETLPYIGSGKDVILNGTTVTGPVMTGKTITGENCTTGDLMGNAGVSIINCTAEKVLTNDAVNLTDSTVKGTVTSGKAIVMKGATVEGDIHARGELTMENTTVTGTLNATTAQLTIKHSTLGGIRLRANGGGMQGQVIVSGGAITQDASGRNKVTLSGTGGKALFKGFNISHGEEGTTVVTPEGNTYLNGTHTDTASNGPATYADYLATHPQAPLVEGPNWQDGTLSDNAETTAEPEKKAAPQQVLELSEGTVVQGDVEFGSGNGLVRLSGGSQVLGRVLGGIVETTPE